METEALRTMTKEACTRLRGKLWPNGIGFNASGWEYSYSESSEDWCALRRPTSARAKRFGRGTTPEQAKANATRDLE